MSPVLFTKSNGSGASLFTSFFNDKGQLVQTNDSSDISVSVNKYNYNAAGSYSVTLTVISDAGCSDTIQQNMVVYPLPVADFSTVPTCLSSSVSFSDLSSVSAGSITSLNWSLGDGTVSVQGSPSHSYTASGNYSATLLVTTNSGCTDSIIKNVAVLDLPIASFQTTNVCLGNSLSFVNNSTTSGSAINSYLWYSIDIKRIIIRTYTTE